MTTSRLDVEKFTGKNDFGLWRIKMKAMLIQQGLADALLIDSNEKKADAGDVKDEAKSKIMMDKAHSAIILCRGDKVLREVAKETSAAAVWSMLESLYMAKSLANRLFMKQRLYSYRFQEDKGIEEQLDGFNKVIDDLENINVSIIDEDKAILLLNAFPKSFDHVRDAMLYGKEKSITLEEVQSALRSRELQRSNHPSKDSMPEALSIKKFKGKKPQKGKNAAIVKGQSHNQMEEKETRKCHWCKKPGHLKKKCFAFKKKQSEEVGAKDIADLAEGFEVAEMLNVVLRVRLREHGSWTPDVAFT